MYFEEEQENREIDMAEIYRQNYMDARDEVNSLNFRIRELEVENALLRRDIERAENHIMHAGS